MCLISVSRRVIINGFTKSYRKILYVYLSSSFAFMGSIYAADDSKKPERQKQALVLYQEQNGPQIISLLSKHLASLSFKELVILAEAYKWEDNHIKRAQTLEQAKNLFPKKVSVRLELAKSYLNEALSYAPTDNFKNAREYNIEKARELFSALVKDQPSLKIYMAYIDFLEKTQGSADEIIVTIKSGINQLGESPYFVSLLCKWHTEANYIEFGLRSCQKAVEMRPKDSLSHLNLAKLLSDSGKKEEAKKSLLKTAQRFPASVPAQLSAAKILNDEGKIVDALKHLENATSIPSEESLDEALVLKAQLLFNLNRVEESLEAYTQACKQHKEPRKPLIKSFKKSISSLEEEAPLKKKFESELYKCKYVYRPKRKKPKGFLSSKRDN